MMWLSDKALDSSRDVSFTVSVSSANEFFLSTNPSPFTGRETDTRTIRLRSSPGPTKVCQGPTTLHRVDSAEEIETDGNSESVGAACPNPTRSTFHGVRPARGSRLDTLRP